MPFGAKAPRMLLVSLRLLAFVLWITASLQLALVDAEDGISLWLGSRTGGALHVNWDISPTWLNTSSVDTIESFNVSVNGTLVGAIDSSARSYDLYGLAQNTIYAVAVQGNLVITTGTALSSNVLLTATLPATNPGAPATPQVISAGGGRLRVLVTLPLDTGGVAISSVMLSVRSMSDSSVFMTLFHGAAEPEFTIYGLTAKSSYHLRTYVVDTAGISGTQSPALYTDTLAAENPSACPAPTVLNTTGGSIALQLNPPVDDGGARIKGYMVYMAVDGSVEYQEVVNTVMTEQMNVVNIQRLPGQPNQPLHPLTRYDFKAVAINMVDVCLSPSLFNMSDSSGIATATTALASLPEAPPAPYFLTATGGQITIQLLMPGNMRGSILTGFLVQVNGSIHGSVASTEERSFVVMPLAALSNYSVQVAVMTDLGTSPWSSELIASTTIPTAPSSVMGVTVSEITASQATVRWSPPVDSGGSAITAYALILVSSTASVRLRSDDSSTRYRLTTLTGDTVYTVKVIAINTMERESSTSRDNGFAFQTTALTIPSEPSSISALSTTGGMIEVSWQAPDASGGASYQELIYNATLFPVASCFNNGGNPIPCGACDLVRVATVNDQYRLALGANGCTQPTTPACPDGTTKCCVTWTFADTMGSGSLCAKTSSTGGRYRIARGGATVTSFQGLSHSTAYYFGVQAINVIGRSTFSPIIGLRTRAQTAPGYPSRLLYTGGSGGMVQLGWSPPLDNGGTFIVGYNVYRDYKLLTPHPILSPFVDCGSGLLASTPYVYGVVAVNASLAEGSMASIVVTTPPVSLPQQIVALTMVGRTVSWLNLTVVTGCDTGGSSALSYQYWLKQGGITINSGFFACCGLLLTGLAPGQEYEVSVRVANEVGALDWVTAYFSTTSGIPTSSAFQLLRSNSYSMVFAIPSIDQEIWSYEVTVSQGGGLIGGESISCDTYLGPSLRACPATYRLSGLMPSTLYQVVTRAFGPSGASDWNIQEWTTSDETAGVLEIASQEYSAFSGSVLNVTVRRVGGTANSLIVGVDVSQPDAVVLQCQCQETQGCFCGLHLRSSGAVSLPGTLTFIDGQENQTVQIAMWDDDPAVTQSTTVLFNLVGSTGIMGAQSQALIHVNPSQRTGYPSFVGSTVDVFENALFVNLQIVRLNGSSGSLSLDVETFDITALSSKNYIAMKQTIQFSDRQSVASVWVQLIDNDFYSESRLVGIRLLDHSNSTFVAAASSDTNAVVTRRIVILDDDDPSRLLPPLPSQVQIVAATGGELAISWQIASSTIATVSGFLVRVSAAQNGTNFFSLYNVESSTPAFILSSLIPNTLYRIQVAAWNLYGESEFTSATLALTMSPTPPSAPRNLQAVLATSGTITLQWDPPRDRGGANVTGYAVWMQGQDGVFHLLVNLTQPVTTYLVQDLSASTPYVFSVAAATTVFPASRTSSTIDWQLWTSGPTETASPPAPEMMNPATSGTLSFLIREPRDLGGIWISDYSLYLRKVSNETSLSNSTIEEPFQVVCSDGTPWVNGASARSCTVYRLLADTSYEAYVVLYNAVGASAPGDRVIARTKSMINLPSAPLGFQASHVTAGNIYLHWDLPQDLGGADDVLGYTVYQKSGNSFADSFFVAYDGQDSTARYIAVKGLTRGAQYQFTIIAHNAASYCTNLDEQHMTDPLVVSTLQYSPLSPPQSIVRVSATGGSITIGWSIPDDLAGVPLHGYVVELLVGQENVTSQYLTAGPIYSTQYTHYGLSEQTPYQYVITAVNQDGPGERSAITTLTTTPCTPPQGVQNMRVVEAFGGRITIAWDPPQDTGGRDIVYYHVTRMDQPNIVYTVTSPAFTDVYGLVARRQYMYSVRAFNGLYVGQLNYLWPSTGEPSVSTTPLLVSVVPYGGKLEVTWSAPHDTGGVPILNYFVTLLDADGVTTISQYQGTDFTVTYSSLTANSPYTLNIFATNEAGAGSNGSYSVFTSDVDLPSAPPSSTAWDVLGGSMRLVVYPPIYTGGGVVTLLLHNGTHVLHTFAPNETDFFVSGLLALTQYKFHVIASNARGQTKGDELVVTTAEVTMPSPVASVQLLEATFEQLSISWPDVVDNGGDAFLQYEITLFLCDINGTALGGSSVTATRSVQTVLVGLAYASYYSVSVRAATSTGLYGASTENAVFMTQEPLGGRIIALLAEMTVLEQSSVISVPLIRVDGSFGDTEYTYAMTDETAIAGQNYVSSNGTVVVGSGVTTSTIDVLLLDDVFYNPNITFVVNVWDVTNTMTQTRVLFLDNGDAGYFSFTAPSFQVLENAGTVALTITRNGGTSPAVVIEPFIMATQSAISERFTLLETSITFLEGAMIHDVVVAITNDTNFQYWPDSAMIGFRILSGGARMGDFVATNLTTADDGDVSPPKQITNLRMTAATGGSMALEWLPPLDRGGVGVELFYQLQFVTGGEIVLEAIESGTNTTVSGLKASTTYEVSVQAVNPAGLGNASHTVFFGTGAATPPTAPLNVDLIAASSSTLLLSWDPPLDTGGSDIVGYEIYYVVSPGNLSPFPSVSCILPTLCSVRGLVALTAYSIHVHALTAMVSTGGGFSSVVVFQTTNPDVPDPPPVASVTWVSAGAMTIQMYNPRNVGGSDVQQYRLFMRGPLDQEPVMKYQGTSDTTTVYGLERRSIYEIKYQAINAVGASEFGVSLNYTTLERSLASAPLGLSVVSSTGGALQMSWSEPLDVGGRKVTGYLLMLKTMDSTVLDKPAVIGYDGRENPETGGVVYGLNSSTLYSMYVIAISEVSNCFSPTEWAASAPLVANTTAPTLPVPAPVLVLVSYTGGIIELTWSPPTDTGGVPITGYTLSAITSTGGVPIYTSDGMMPRAFVHTDLIESTVYTYAVRAYTSVGGSPLSDPVVVKTLVATAPSVPRNLTQLPYVTGGTIHIGWDRPIDTGGQPIRGYWIYRNGMAIVQNLDAAVRSYTDNQNLKAATSYEYMVRAYSWSTMGSEMSAPLTAATSPATKPLRPMLTSNVTGASFIVANWSADADTGGAPVLLFEATLMRATTVVGSYSGLATSFRFTGLLATTSYTLQIVTYNQVGVSNPLSVAFMTRVAVTPDAPLAPLAVLVFGGNITVEMSAPVATGGTAILAMRVYETKLGFRGTATMPMNGVPTVRFTAAGLLKTTDYSFTTSAVNALGEGKRSPILAVRTGPASLPGPLLVAPIVTNVAGTFITVVWTTPVDSGGDTALSYEIRFMEGTATALTLLSVTREIQGTGLKYNTVYSISVRVVNTAGKGDWSPSTAIKTLPDAAGSFSFKSSAVSVSEAASQVTLTVQRTNGVSGVVTVAFAVLPPSTNAAMIGKDFALVPGSLKTTGTITFSPLQVEGNITIFILNDDLYESPNEQFIVQLTSATLSVSSPSVTAAKIGANATSIVTILDDGDAGTLSFPLDRFKVQEDAVSFTVPIIRQGGKSGRITVGFKFIDGTATGDRDYRRILTTQVTMEDNQIAAMVRVFIINDKTYEFPNEFFMLEMIPLSGGARLKRSTTTIEINDDGDVSVAAPPPPPVVLETTGGRVRLQLSLPAHNGSAQSQLMSYTVRIANPQSDSVLFNVTTPVLGIVNIGNLTAQSVYEVSVATNNTAGQSPFSPAATFATSVPTLPSAVVSATKARSTGGSIELAWPLPGDTGGVPITKYRIYSITPHGVPVMMLELLRPVQAANVTGLACNTTYFFVIQAGNTVLVPELAHGWGALGPSMQFTTPNATLPGPTQISKDVFRPATGGSITISFAAPEDTGGTPIAGFHVYARNATSAFLLAVQVPQNTSRSVVIEELYAANWYEIFVLAENSVEPIGLPGSVTCVPGSASLLTTQDLSKKVASGSVLRVNKLIFLIGDMARATKGTLPLMMPYVGARLAKIPASILGVASQFANLSTSLASIPRDSQQITLVNATGGAIAFRVESPGDTGGVPIDYFTVLINGTEPDDDVVRKEWSQPTNLRKTLIMRISNLDPFAAHEITAVAGNAISLCDFSKTNASIPVIFETTSVTRPEPPQIAAQFVTGGGMSLFLKDPYDKGGQDIVKSTLYMATDLTVGDWALVYASDENVTAEERSTTVVAGLQPVTKYFFKLTVSNGVFESKNSSVASFSTSSVSPPGACTEPTFVAATGGMLTVAWVDPRDTGGANITSFRITIQLADGTGDPSSVGNIKSHNYTFYGLTAETEYFVSVRALNVKGIGPVGAPASFATTEGTPPLGSIAVDVLSSTGGAAIISFNEPDDLGGTPKEDMEYHVLVENDHTLTLTYDDLAQAAPSPEGGGRRLAAGTGGITVGGLDPLGLYDIQIQAVNAFDSGNVSSAAPATTTAATLPSEPRTLTVSQVTGGSVLLTWLSPADTGGLPLLDYVVYMATVEAGPFNVQCRDTITQCTITSLNAATNYWFYVVTSNALGDSAFSETVHVTTLAVSIPSAPGKILIISVSESTIDCSWSLPKDTGGSPITTYTITVNNVSNGGTLAPITATTSPVQLTGLSPGTQYSIDVVATNQLLRSSFASIPRLVTTSSSISSPVDPSISCVSSNAVSLVWFAYPGATRYQLYQNGTVVYTGTATDFIDTSPSITSDSYFEYKVEAELSGAWTGVLSSAVVAHTLDAVQQGTTICTGSVGSIRDLNYQPNTNKTWLLTPAAVFDTLTIEFTSFDLECDHDLVRIESISDGTLLWTGGCKRSGTFIIQATQSTRVVFTTDASLEKSGFELSYEIDLWTVADAATRIPPPVSGNGATCSSHGARQDNGSCKCSVGFTGEDCSNHVVCCTDVKRCWHPVCDRDPQRVVTVSNEFGDDLHGTGRMMNASERGTASKAVQTISKALSLASPGDVIFLYPGVYKGALNRDIQFVSRSDLSVQSLKGFAWTAIDCEGAARAMSLTGSSVTIEGVTIRNGQTPSVASDGGTIWATDSSLAIRNVLITGSTATRNGGAVAAIRSSISLNASSIELSSAPSGAGGGVYLMDSQFAMVHSNVTTCKALGGAAVLVEGSTTTLTGEGSASFLKCEAGSDGGGGVLVRGHVSLTNLQITANQAVTGGGILAVDGAQIIMDRCDLVQNKAIADGGGMTLTGTTSVRGKNVHIGDNTATLRGGAIFLQNAQATLNFDIPSDVALLSRIRENVAANGAGIYATDSTMALTGVTIQNGSASESGGGIGASHSSITLSKVNISSNVAATMGGGLFATQARVTNIIEVVVDYNVAQVHGGGMYLDTTDVAGPLLLLRNSATQRGGGFYAEGKASLQDMWVRECSADQGGGGHILHAVMTLHNVTVTDCTASSSGGGLSMNASSIRVTDSLVQHGTSVLGGGVSTYDSCLIDGDLWISQCSATEDGGALYSTDALVLKHLHISDSTAKRGGGVFTVKSAAAVENVTVTSCHASLEGGGWSAHDSSLLLNDVRLVNHQSDATGGAMMLRSSSVTHANVSVIDSQAIRGGGVYLHDSSFRGLSSGGHEIVSSIVDNKALQHGGNVFIQGDAALSALLIEGGETAGNGGGVAMQQANVTISDCSITRNRAGERGGGIRAEGSSKCDLLDSTISDNVAKIAGGGFSVSESTVNHGSLVMERNRAVNGGCFAVDGACQLVSIDSNRSSLVNASQAMLSSKLKGNGSAIYLAPLSVVRVSGLYMYEGYAAKGAVFIDQSAVLRLSDCHLADNTAGAGAALYATMKSSVVLNNTQFLRNSATGSGGALLLAGLENALATAEITNCEFGDNFAQQMGGAIAMSYTTLTMLSTHLETNSIGSTDGGGGAIAAISFATVTILECTFLNNTILHNEAKGGTLYLLSDTTASIERTTLHHDPNGQLAREGGIVYVSGKSSILDIVDCVLADGQAFSGASIHVTEATVSLLRTTVRGGNANEFGAGLYIDGGIVELLDSEIYDNSAVYDGGGVFVRGKSSLTIRSTAIENNRVQDGGGGIYIAPGGGAFVNISHSTIVANKNHGLGSAIFIGRKNSLELTACDVIGNGDETTEGGGLYAVDAKVTVHSTTFMGNRAVRGAAIELGREAQLTMVNSDLQLNQVTLWGGAMYLSGRATAWIHDSTFSNNTAATGGALYLLGSSTVHLDKAHLEANIARSFGGAITTLARATLAVSACSFVANQAYTGGALSITQNATVMLTTGNDFTSNGARDFGGAVYIDTLTTTAEHAIQLESMGSAANNSARAGNDIYWVFHPWFILSCPSCGGAPSLNQWHAATSPVAITVGWWPTSVTSGVSLGIIKPNWKNPALLEANQTTFDEPSGFGSAGSGSSPVRRRRLGSLGSSSSSSSSSSSAAANAMDQATLVAIAADASLSSPYVSMVWPTLVVRDYYGAIASQDNQTTCLASKRISEMDKFDFFPPNPVETDRGYVTLSDAQVMASSRVTPFELVLTCTLADKIERELVVSLHVENCSPGYENTDGLDGVKCHLCPLGATCEQLDESKSVIGVSIPSRAEGFFLFESRDTYQSSNCDDPSSWDAADPCRDMDTTLNMTYRLQNCSNAPTFEKYWPRKRVFACLSSMEYYTCDNRDACLKENATAVVEASSVVELSQLPQCDSGYGSVTCSTCASGYYKVSNGTCNVCSDPNDAAVARMTHLMAMIPIGMFIIAVILVWVYFSNSFENEIMKQANAARKFQVLEPHGARPRKWFQAAGSFIKQRVDDLIQRAWNRIVLRLRNRQHGLFQIEPKPTPNVPFRAEKFKIMLGFFQIFGGFKKLYEIPWPNDMSRLMDLFSIADFSLVDTTSIECFIHKDYFTNYRLSLIAVLILLLFTTLLLSWGVVRYRVKLTSLPRHCVRCGLPVFELLRRKPKTLVRRATMVSMLRIAKKQKEEGLRRRSFVTRAKGAMAAKAGSWGSRFSAWWSQSRLGKLVDRFAVFTRLPASSSEHFPSCPTSQTIQAEVQDMVVRSNLRLWRARIRLRLNYQSFQNKCIKLLFWILLLFYPELSQRVVGMFYCDEIGSDYYMSRDKSQLCYRKMWLYYLPLTVLLLVVWVIGVPLLFWTIIFFKRSSGIEDKLILLEHVSNIQLKKRLVAEMHDDLVQRGIHVDEAKIHGVEREMMVEFLRNKKLNEPSMIAQVGFIYHSYRTQFWWFEVWDLGRKLFLNSVIGLLAKTGANRIIAGLIVFLIYLSVMLFYQPYKEPSDSALAGITQIQLFITLFCGLMLKMGALHMEDAVISLLTYVAFFSNVLTISFAVFSISYEKWDATRKAKRRAREDHRRAIQEHVRKLWRKAYGYACTEVYFRDKSIRPMPVHVMLELARRDRVAHQMQELDEQLVRSFPVLPNTTSDRNDAVVEMADVQVHVPPLDETVIPSSPPSSRSKEPTLDHSKGDGEGNQDGDVVQENQALELQDSETQPHEALQEVDTKD